jgi:hypothetical protein
MFAVTDGSGWAYKILECDIWPTPTGWMPRLMDDPAFVEQLKQRYTFLRKNIISNNNIMNYIDSVNSYIATAQVRHYQKWQILGQNVGASKVDAIPRTYEGETIKFKNWITTLLAWLDQQMLITSNPILPGLNPSEVCMSLYPNPARTNLDIETDKAIKTISVYSLMGQAIFIKPDINKNKYELDIQKFTQGLYIVKLFLQDGKTISNQVVIE